LEKERRGRRDFEVDATEEGRLYGREEEEVVDEVEAMHVIVEVVVETAVKARSCSGWTWPKHRLRDLALFALWRSMSAVGYDT